MCQSIKRLRRAMLRCAIAVLTTLFAAEALSCLLLAVTTKHCAYSPRTAAQFRENLTAETGGLQHRQKGSSPTLVIHPYLGYVYNADGQKVSVTAPDVDGVTSIS